MTVTVVRGRGALDAMSDEDFDALRAPYARVHIDIGTGDGRFAYVVAGEEPETFVIGLDPVDDNVVAYATKARRKPAKGGRPNLVFVRSAIETAPLALHRIADEVTVHLPWGRLLEGIVLPDEAVLGGIAAVCAPDANVVITLNAEIWLDSTPDRYGDLPLPTPDYVAEVVAPGFAQAGIALGPARMCTAEEAKGLPTTWAKRLGHDRTHPQFVYVEGVAG